jgi:hypothetical protein
MSAQRNDKSDIEWKFVLIEYPMSPFAPALRYTLARWRDERFKPSH